MRNKYYDAINLSVLKLEIFLECSNERERNLAYCGICEILKYLGLILLLKFYMEFHSWEKKSQKTTLVDHQRIELILDLSLQHTSLKHKA